MAEREILFRGKRTDNGKWICGHLLEQNIPDYHSYIVASFIAEQDNRHTEIIEFAIYEVIPETIGQYTGLTDKNGVKIFEGDVLKQKTTTEFAKVNPFEWEKYGIVRFGVYDWRPSYAGYRSVSWYVEPLKNVPINPSNYGIGNIDAGLNQVYISNQYYPYEVIGNIHDNPELLKSPSP